MQLPDMRTLNQLLKNVPEPVADALRHVSIESHLQLDRAQNEMRGEYEAVARDSVFDSLSNNVRISALERGKHSMHFAPPGVTDDVPMNPQNPAEVSANLPSLIQALQVDETTGALKYKAQRQRHTMGSLTQRDTDADWTALAGLVAADARLASGTATGQLAYWNNATGVNQWQPFALGASGTFLRCNGPFNAPDWTDQLPLTLHAWSHTSHHWDATANEGAGGWVASDDAIPTATVNHTGLLRALLADDPAVKYLRSDGEWAIPPDTNTFSPLGDYAEGNVIEYGTVEDVEGWRSVSGGYARVLAWLSTYERTEGVPLQSMIPVRIPRYLAEEGGGTPTLISDDWEIAPLADILGMTATDTTPAWPKYLRQVSDGEGGFTLEWEDLCDQDGVPNNSLPYWYSNDNEIRLKYLPKGTDGQILTSNTSGDPDWTTPTFAAGTHAATHHADGADSLADYFELIGHDHDDRYALIHTHPYVPIDYDYPLAEVLSWLTEGATAADDPWQLLVLKPVSNGDPPETWSFQTSTETISTALIGAGIKDESTLYPKYLRIVQVEGVDTLEWEDLCDDTAQTSTLAYWKEDGKLGVIGPGTEGQFLKSNGTGEAPAFSALPSSGFSYTGIPANNNILHWVASVSQWQTFAPPWLEAPASPAPNDLMKYNGTAWSAYTPPAWVVTPSGTVLDKAISLWSVSGSDVTATHLHFGNAIKALYWNANSGLASVGDATDDKQVLTWNASGAPTWSDPQVPADVDTKLDNLKAVVSQMIVDLGNFITNSVPWDDSVWT